MLRSYLIGIAIASVAISAPAAAQTAPADEATKFVTTIIDKFNAGDAKAWLSAQQDNTLIVDEFALHVWSGAGSPQRWLDAYANDTKQKGVSGGRVDYGKPLQATQRWKDCVPRPAHHLQVRPKGHQDGRAQQHDVRHDARRRCLEDRELDLLRLSSGCT